MVKKMEWTIKVFERIVYGDVPGKVISQSKIDTDDIFGQMKPLVGEFSPAKADIWFHERLVELFIGE
jgi:hypothetical protein